jgi:hypothetical protein
LAHREERERQIDAAPSPSKGKERTMNANVPSLGNFASERSSVPDGRRWLRRMWWGNLIAVIGYLLVPFLFALVNDRQTDEWFRLMPVALEATQELLEAVVEFRQPLLLISLAGFAATSLYRVSVPPDDTTAPPLLTGAMALVGGVGLLTAGLPLGGLVLAIGVMILSWLAVLVTLIVVLLLLSFAFVSVYLIHILFLGF